MRPQLHCVRACLLGALASFSALGCGSVDEISEKERENVALRFESARRRESLIEAFEEVARLKQGITDLHASNSTLEARISELSDAARSASEQLAAASQQKAEALAKVAELQESNDRLRDSADKVKEVAGASAGELAELRTKRTDLESHNAALVKREAELRGEAERLSRQVRDLEAELHHFRSPSPNGVDPYAQRLEREVAGLRGENFALQKRLEAISVATGMAPPPAPVPNSVYREDPAGLFRELGGLLVLRYNRAREGNIAWDGFDIGVVAAAGLVVILFFIGLFRLCFRRQPKALNVGSSSTARSGEANPEEATDASETAQPAEAAPRRKPPVRRRTGYPAIISARNVRTSEDAARDAEGIAAEVTQTLDVALDESAVTQRLEAVEPEARRPGGKTTRSVPAGTGAPKGANPETRRIIGARSWEPEEGVDEREPDDELARTQVIAGITGDGDEDSVPARSSSKSQAAGAQRSAPKAPAREPGRPTPAPAEGSDDRQLLQELKSVINRKFDELMK